MSFKSKARYLYRWDLIPERLYDRYIRYKRALPHREYWKSLKDKHKGEACFIIGNGPSLKMEDLSKIKENGFISIASNKIYLAFEQTDWRPDYFTVADDLVWDKIKDKVHNDIKIVHISSKLDNKGSNKITKYWNTLDNSYNVKKSDISSNISKGMNTGATITYENIQIAIYLGCNPIYLIGCDHYYDGEKNIENGIKVEQTEKQTHFIKGYRDAGEIVWAAPIKKMSTAYKIAKKYADENNIVLLNATRGGHLEVFDRVDIDKVFNK